MNYEKTIVSLAEAKKYASLRDFLATLNPADIAVLTVWLAKQKGRERL